MSEQSMTALALANQNRMSPAKAQMTAAAMRATGWEIRFIRDHLASQGVDRSMATVRRWADPVVAERKREKDREWRANWVAQSSPCRLGRPVATRAYKLARMRVLRDEAGLGNAQIGRVMGLDFGELLTRNQVFDALRLGRYPMHPTTAASSSAAKRSTPSQAGRGAGSAGMAA